MSAEIQLRSHPHSGSQVLNSSTTFINSFLDSDLMPITVIIRDPNFPFVLNVEPDMCDVPLSRLSFTELKTLIWSILKKDDMLDCLRPSHSYHFEFVNNHGSLEKLYSGAERRRLGDIQRFGEFLPEINVLALVPSQQEEAEERAECLRLVVGAPAADAEMLQEMNCLGICDMLVPAKTFAAEVRSQRDRVTEEDVLSSVKVHHNYVENIITKVNLSSTTPRELMHTFLLRAQLNIQLKDDMVLKVSGHRQFLLEDVPLVEFNLVRSKLRAGNDCLLLRTAQKEQAWISRKLGNEQEVVRPPAPLPVASSVQSILTLSEAIRYEVVLIGMSIADARSCSVVMGLAHGSVLLADTPISCAVLLDSSTKSASSFPLVFPFKTQVCNLPRATKLCIIVHRGSSQTGSSKRGTRSIICWANLNVFDWHGRLCVGMHQVHLWPREETSAHGVSPYGLNILAPPGNNYQIDDMSPEYTMTLLLLPAVEESFVSGVGGLPLTYTYPSLEEQLHFLVECSSEKKILQTNEPSSSEEKIINQLCTLDSLSASHLVSSSEDKLFMWNNRLWLKQNCPATLPRLMAGVNWHDRHEVAMVSQVLHQWQLDEHVEVEVALELLEYCFPEPQLRLKAVNRLELCSDSELCLYLPQLVQCVKFESYLNSPLCVFLLSRAVKNRLLAQTLYFLIRAEMRTLSLTQFFGALLEIYLKSVPEHLAELHRLVSAHEKLQFLNTKLKRMPTFDKAVDLLHEMLKTGEIYEAMRGLICPVLPDVRLKTILPADCKVMDSKMRPLLIWWRNSDPEAGNIGVIYKKGDDLRQDLLILNIIRCMEMVWMRCNLDLHMTPYNVVCSGCDRDGFIEVVQRSKTVAKILTRDGQVQRGTGKEALFHWLKKHNPSPESLKRAVHNFRRSCAGYCVATYILGIADRHSDNIMVAETGHLFHIDFGHILGNFKYKMGVKREWVPFVLVEEFIEVVRYFPDVSSPTSPNEAVANLKELCLKAYMAIRQRGRLFVSLFKLMVSAGLPELSKAEDIEYLTDTLQLDQSPEDARDHFGQKFDNSLRTSWTVRLNWFMHHINRRN